MADPTSVLRWMHRVLDMGENGRIPKAEAEAAIIKMVADHEFAQRIPGPDFSNSKVTY